VKTSFADESDHLLVRNGCRPMHLFIGFEKLPPPPFVANEELTEDEFVASNLIFPEQSVEFGRIGFPIREEANPDRGVDKDHQAARRLAEGTSRRLGTPFAPGSEPRRAR